MPQTFAIECPLRPDHTPVLVREQDGEFALSLRYEDDPEVPSLVPRFMGDRCEFVAPSGNAGARIRDVELCTTDCPLHPASGDARACFLQSSTTGR